MDALELGTPSLEHSQHVLFLQGPLGPFFRELAKTFSQAGYITHRIALNGGDLSYAGGDHVASYTDTPDQWPTFFAHYLQQHKITAVFLMGDCRYYHRTARPICERLGVRFMVFEEGYLRPNTITLEEHGVNALSQLDLSPTVLADIAEHKCISPVVIGDTMKARTRFAAIYYWAAWFARKRFPHYQHHRAFHPVIEGAKWWRGFGRKLVYKDHDRTIEMQLQSTLRKRFYMVALQVHDDSQMIHHSNYSSVEAFIEEVIGSFVAHAPKGTTLLLKHHPMDRGYTHYGEQIKKWGERLGISERLIYCHDLRLPSIYNHCLGVVTVNSTVGMSALLHKVPVKVMGRAMYDLLGLTSQCSLDRFWQEPEPVNIDLFHKLQSYLFDKTQINGCFFTHLKLTCDNVLTFYQKHFEASQKHATYKTITEESAEVEEEAAA